MVAVLLLLSLFVACNFLAMAILLKPPKLNLTDSNLEKVTREWRKEMEDEV